VGRYIVKEISYTPSFTGKHNEIKSKCWLILYDRYLENRPGLTLLGLVNAVGCSYKSLSVLLGRWIRWGFIGYRSRPGGREYHLNKTGRAWIDRWRYTMPLDQYIQEIEAWQKAARRV